MVTFPLIQCSWLLNFNLLRYAEAHASRARAESLLRYSLYVDSMPTEDIPPLTTEQVCGLLSQLHLLARTHS